jgi:hypothetical protein
MEEDFDNPNSPINCYKLEQSLGNTSSRQVVGHLEQAIADMRSRVTEKYSIQFRFVLRGLM